MYPRCVYIYYKINKFESSLNTISQYLLLEVRRDPVLNILGILIYISYYDCVVSLKMAFIAETGCWLLLTDKVVSGFHRASMISVTFINQLMHSIITVIDVKILLYKSLKDTH